MVKGSLQKTIKFLQLKFNREIGPVIKNFHSWLEHHKNFPKAYNKFLLRDILHYNDEDIKELSLVDYNLAVHYAMETYVRRDLLFIMNRGKKRKTGKDEIEIEISHPEIEEWISQQYQEEE